MSIHFETTKSWNRYIGEFFKQNGQSDIYFTEEYVSLNIYNDSEIECFVCCENCNCFIFPYIKRSLNFNGVIYYDFETAYGYGGFLVNSDDVDFITKSLNLLIGTMKNNNFIAGFIRFHPLLKNSIYAAGYDEIELFFDRKTVSFDLTKSSDEIFKNIQPRRRSTINQAVSRGIECIFDHELKYISEFQDMYRHTMMRLNADSFYFFSADYFDKLRNLINKKVFLALCKYEGRIVAGALIFLYDIFGHYHLGGSYEEYQKFYPNNLLFYSTAVYLKEFGCRLFHLGGGTDGNSENSLYQYKKKFSNSYHDFYIGKCIFNKEIYSLVCDKWAKNNPEKCAKYKKLTLCYRY
ncbi:MAG: GNAT family N-acetyltransferase [Candidatus Wallbacteria bacterium]